MNVVLFWDIDGTLLTTQGRGFPALKSSVLKTLELDANEIDFSSTHGVTDFETIANLSGFAYEDLDPKLILEIISDYEDKISSVFTESPPKVLPNIEKALVRIQNESRWKISIGSGNSFGGAKIKIRTAGLTRFFDEENYFCATLNNWKREWIIRDAANSLGKDEVGIVIGDTPADVVCATKSGLKSIAIPTGAFSKAKLLESGADHVLAADWKVEHLFNAILKYE